MIFNILIDDRLMEWSMGAVSARSTTYNGRSHYPSPSKDRSRENRRWTSTINDPKWRNTSNITSMHPRVRRRIRSSMPLLIGYVSIWHIDTTSRSTSSSSIKAWGGIRGNAVGAAETETEEAAERTRWGGRGERTFAGAGGVYQATTRTSYRACSPIGTT
jgi:hypothetical protein